MSQLVSIFTSTITSSHQHSNNTLKHPSPSSSPIIAGTLASAISTSYNKDTDKSSNSDAGAINIQHRRHSGTAASILDQIPRVPGYNGPMNLQTTAPRSRSNSIGTSLSNNKETVAFNYSNNTSYKVQMTPTTSTKSSSGKHIPYAYSPPVNNNTNISPSSTGNIGMMGNLIAFVFNSSPASVQKQNQNSYHGNNVHQARSLSLDASTTGSDSSKHRSISQYSVCEEYFTTGDHSKSNNSQITTDGDFVMVNNSPTVIDKTSQKSTSNYQKNVPFSVIPKVVEVDAFDLENSAILSFYESLVHRCEVYCTVVNAISALGDQYVLESLLLSSTMTQQQRQQQIHHTSHNDNLDNYLHSCSLYLHALSILSRLMKSVDSKLHVSSVVDQSNLNIVITSLKQVVMLINFNKDTIFKSN